MQGFSRPLKTDSDNNATVPQVVPVTSGGTFYYLNPSLGPNLAGGAMPINVSSTTPMTIGVPGLVPTVSIAKLWTEPTAFMVQDLVQLQASPRKEQLTVWKLAQYNGDPLQWHEWIGQFKSAIDSALLTHDVKLTYSKTLVFGKAMKTIAEFVYCRTMYRDALRTSERKFGQPRAVVSAYLDKLSKLSSLEMYDSERLISYSATNSALVGLFQSLHYHQGLSKASLLGLATEKLPPNLRETWSIYTVEKNWDLPTLTEFNNSLKHNAEAHERMKLSSEKQKIEVSNPPADVTRTK